MTSINPSDFNSDDHRSKLFTIGYERFFCMMYDFNSRILGKQQNTLALMIIK